MDLKILSVGLVVVGMSLSTFSFAKDTKESARKPAQTAPCGDFEYYDRTYNQCMKIQYNVVPKSNGECPSDTIEAGSGTIKGIKNNVEVVLCQREISATK